MRDVELLKSDPSALFDKFMLILNSGGTLSATQLIMMEALKKILNTQAANGI
jgi:hypothetical protein